jgi:hypothetical protein
MGSATWLALAPSASAAPRTAFDEAADREALGRLVTPPTRRVCDWDPQPGHVRCHSHVVVDLDGRWAPMAPNSGKNVGLNPTDIQSAYKLPSTGGSSKTVAIIDAFDAPTIEADMAYFRSEFALPACTSASGCFRKLNQRGISTDLPQANADWAAEITIDVEMISAACPDCKIMLFEADTDTNTDVLATMQVAIGMGVDAVSNSFGATEDSTEPDVDKLYYSAAADGGPGGNALLIGVSTGDTGYGANYPATSSYVVAVGGTTLTTSASSRGWAEAAWSKGGSGCSAYIKKPSWQTDPGCNNRMEADVAAVADSATPVFFYCSDCTSPDAGGGSGGADGSWYAGSGTSVAAPIVVGALMVLGIAPNAGTSWPEFIWARHSALFDVTTGSNGTCTTSYFCNAAVGYDGPTGWGTLDGNALMLDVASNDAGPDAGARLDAGSADDATAAGGPDAAVPSVDATASTDGAADGSKESDGGTPSRDASAANDASTANDAGAVDGRPSIEAASADAEVQASLGSDAATVAAPGTAGGNSSSGCACALVRPANRGLADLASGLVLMGVLGLRRRRNAAVRATWNESDRRGRRPGPLRA